jgi:hypothetical protein
MYDHRLLAEGDSWFTLGGLPTSNLLFSMKFDASAIIVNCGSPSDTIRGADSVQPESQKGDEHTLRLPMGRDLGNGGNDLIDDADES